MEQTPYDLPVNKAKELFQMYLAAYKYMQMKYRRTTKKISEKDLWNQFKRTPIPLILGYIEDSDVKNHPALKWFLVRFESKMDVRQYILETYYSTHGYPYTFKDFINVEVRERGNYSLREVRSWQQKYKIHDRQPCIWIAETIRDAKRYEPEISSNELYKYRETDGFVIPESDDGDGGYLFILNK